MQCDMLGSVLEEQYNGHCSYRCSVYGPVVLQQLTVSIHLLSFNMHDNLVDKTAPCDWGFSSSPNCVHWESEFSKILTGIVPTTY